MTKQYTVKIVFVATGQNLITGEQYALSLDKNYIKLPTFTLDNNIIHTVLSDIKSKYIDLHEEWISTQPKNFFIYGDSLLLIYTSIIPLDTQLKDAYWVPLLNIDTDELTQNILRNIF
jgi:hypothetical protein